jgi:hypothetical protein
MSMADGLGGSESCANSLKLGYSRSLAPVEANRRYIDMVGSLRFDWPCLAPRISSDGRGWALHERVQKQEETYMPDALRIMKANELLEIERLKQREEQEEEYEELRMAQDELDEARARGEFPDSDEDL